jgi:cell division protease FtsH
MKTVRRLAVLSRGDSQGSLQGLSAPQRISPIPPGSATWTALTPGFTGADLANLVNEAALLATRRGADAVTMADFTNAVERMVAGLEKRNRLLNPREGEIVAIMRWGMRLSRFRCPALIQCTRSQLFRAALAPSAIPSSGPPRTAS